MNISLAKSLSPADCAILPVFKEEQAKQIVKQKLKLDLPTAADSDFKKDLGTVQLVYTAVGRIMLVGMGDKKSFQPANWRVVLHSTVNTCTNLGIKSASLAMPNFPKNNLEKYLELTGFALLFSSYRFDTYKQEKPQAQLEKLDILVSPNQKLQKALNRGITVGIAANQARDLANHPGNVATPSHLAEHARQVAKTFKFDCKVWGPKEIQKEGMGLLMGVAAGSEEEPRFIMLDY